jgi:hypothetical protein
MSAPLSHLELTELAQLAEIKRIGSVERIDNSGDDLPLGRVTWLDCNGNALSEAEIASSPLAGVSVSLRDESGAELARTVTDARGNYLFDDLPMGQYTVVFTAPSSVIAAGPPKNLASNGSPARGGLTRPGRSASALLSAAVPIDLDEAIPTTTIQTWSVAPTGWGDQASVLRVAGTLG